MVCLDTSFIIDLLHDHKEVYSVLIELQGYEDIFIPSPVVMELWFGICHQERSSTEKNKVLALFRSLHILSLDEQSAKESAEIRISLKKKGKIIGIEDCMIAAIAKVHNHLLVTSDSDFSSIEGLRVLKY